MHLRQKTVWSAHPMGKTGSKKSRSIKCFASTVTNQLFCPLASSLIHECVRAHAVILLWAGFNVLVQSGTAEGSHRSLLRGVFILTRLTERHIKPQTSHSSTAMSHSSFTAPLSLRAPQYRSPARKRYSLKSGNRDKLAQKSNQSNQSSMDVMLSQVFMLAAK